MANGHGGYRQPADPAATSGPGRYSRRTDGGPAAAGRISGQPYGEGQQANRLLRAADRPPSGRAVAGGPPPAPPSGSQAAPGPGLPDVFGPTKRPDEPITTGAPGGPAPAVSAPRDPDRALRLLAQKSLDTFGFIHPELRMLLERRDLG